MSAQDVTLRLVVHGRVQGVCFRDSMREEAETRQVNGWVRNRPDRAVEAVVQGAAADVDAIVRWAHHGPSMAEVTQVDVEQTGGTYTSFEILY